LRLPDDIVLRPVGDADLPLLRAIYGSAREAELACVAWTTNEKAEFLRSQFDLQHRYYQAHFPCAEFSVIQYGSRDVGRWYVDWHGVELRLIDIALLPEWRNRGIGSGLLRGLLAMSDQLRKTILLHVEVNSPALSLYRRLGFATCADNGVYSRMFRPAQSLAA